MERELRLAERENEILRNRASNEGNRPEVQTRVNIKAVSELLSEFDDSEGLFQNWEKQLKLLSTTYQLDANNAKVLIGMRLKGKALEWFHSRPEHLELTIEEILVEMKKIFDQRQSRLRRRKQFEERRWKYSENFSEYYHEKVILANRVPVDEEEMVEYLIDGIANVQLRNQARLQQFDTKSDLLAAFENISLSDSKCGPEREAKTGNKDQKGIHTAKREESPKKSAAEASNVALAKPRCFNCSKFGHMSKDCKLPKREKGTCFKCGEKGHVISECTGKAEANQINCVDSAWMDNDFQKRVKLMLINSSLNCEVELKALIDTGSPISFVKEKMIPSNFINYDNTEIGRAHV